MEAAALLPSYGGVTGWGALRWSGGHWFDGLTDGGRTLLPVTLAAGGNIRERPGVRICEEGLNPKDLCELDGLRITTAVRSVCYEMRYAASDRLAVVALDMATFSDLVSIDELWAYALAHAAWTGIPRCRRAAGLADENSWSPRETLLRLVWELDAGLRRPLCNVPIFDESGRHIGTPDLFDPQAGVAGEYDGALHLLGAQRARDLRREEKFRNHGLEYVTMLAGDQADPAGLVARLLATFDRASAIPASRKRWTLTPPPWWVDTTTVLARRELTEAQRLRLLRNRAG
ncbi:hypothetical protein [Nocardioides koreensis]|uniref:hypothetical protein n=1 Tax=Nocardioides koreensis TaxID=433651 RepID=UPI0031DC5307